MENETVSSRALLGAHGLLFRRAGTRNITVIDHVLAIL
jgi:hypothetical protein